MNAPVHYRHAEHHRQTMNCDDDRYCSDDCLNHSIDGWTPANDFAIAIVDRHDCDRYLNNNCRRVTNYCDASCYDGIAVIYGLDCIAVDAEAYSL